MFGIYTCAYAVVAPLLGRASDARGRRTSVRLGAGAFALLACALAAVIRLEPTGIAGAPRVVLHPAAPGGLRAWTYSAVAGFALANAAFWPALQARLGDRAPSAAALARSVRRFNIGWTAGKACGFLVAGLLFAYAPSACLPLAAGCAGLVLLCALADRAGAQAASAGSPPPEHRASERPPRAMRRAYLLAALLANLVLWGSLATLKGLAPKLGAHLGLGPRATGCLLFAALVAQGLAFAGLGSARRWAYRPGLLRLAAPSAALGLGFWLLAGQLGGGSALVFASALLGAALVGSAQAVTYAASVFYSLDYDEHRGLRTGIHEAVLGLGGGLEVLGGALADATAWDGAPLLFMSSGAALGALGVAWLLRPRAGGVSANSEGLGALCAGEEG